MTPGVAEYARVIGIFKYQEYATLVIPFVPYCQSLSTDHDFGLWSDVGMEVVSKE
jgi:hypothetical protein